MPSLLIVGAEPQGRKKKYSSHIEKHVWRTLRMMHKNGWDFLGANRPGITNAFTSAKTEWGIQYRELNLTAYNCNALDQAERVMCCWDTIDTFPFSVFSAATAQGIPATLLVFVPLTTKNTHIYTYQNTIVPPPFPAATNRYPKRFDKVATCLTHE